MKVIVLFSLVVGQRSTPREPRFFPLLLLIPHFSTDHSSPPTSVRPESRPVHQSVRTLPPAQLLLGAGGGAGGHEPGQGGGPAALGLQPGHRGLAHPLPAPQHLQADRRVVLVGEVQLRQIVRNLLNDGFVVVGQSDQLFRKLVHLVLLEVAEVHVALAPLALGAAAEGEARERREHVQVEHAPAGVAPQVQPPHAVQHELNVCFHTGASVLLDWRFHPVRSTVALAPAPRGGRAPPVLGGGGGGRRLLPRGLVQGHPVGLRAPLLPADGGVQLLGAAEAQRLREGVEQRDLGRHEERLPRVQLDPRLVELLDVLGLQPLAELLLADNLREVLQDHGDEEVEQEEVAQQRVGDEERQGHGVPLPHQLVHQAVPALARRAAEEHQHRPHERAEVVELGDPLPVVGHLPEEVHAHDAVDEDEQDQQGANVTSEGSSLKQVLQAPVLLDEAQHARGAEHAEDGEVHGRAPPAR
eukprot:CAMPEP_0206397844 /NCGR_PEP_ID=MMETSP0294-20121207/23773_1 /ASSEMBLY_ACC=CAM_ASM_000327 /TAXON_ID=39354 /ORGANISM="Heterosigma akashiwo, Strain CCMP2393" /LENGTH=469 /DNA_ID=CAMNT_0053853145 /DNA_START=362 /DNA_END=1769 /DNA_ORIENTATION=-